MKNPDEIIKTMPKEALEWLTFLGAVILGALHKVLRLNQEKGVRITMRKMLVETFMSFFIALVVYAVFDQFLHFNRFFTLMMCSLASSNSAFLYNKTEDLFSHIFDACKVAIDKHIKPKGNEAN